MKKFVLFYLPLIQEKILRFAKLFNKELKEKVEDDDKWLLQDVITLLSNIKTAIKNSF